MSRLPLAAAVLLFLAGTASTAEQNNTAVEENWCGSQAICGLHDDDGPWMSVLQQWALSAPEHGERQGRIMAIPAAQGYYVSERVEGMLAPPPAPHKTQNRPLPPGARPYDEWHAAPPTAGKIVNRPPNPYKDKFKPSYPAPVQNQPIPVHGHTVDRVDENRQPPQKQVSETDLYLLGAIEKLVWRADLFEKRLRKLEESIHLMAAGLEAKKEDEPCDENFMRVGEGCYHVSSDAQNWKGASYGCRRLKSNMLEIDSDKEKEQLANKLSSDKKYKGIPRSEDRGFILIDPIRGPIRGSSACDMERMCSPVACVWLLKQIRAAILFMTLFFMVTLGRFLSSTIRPNIILTYKFAKLSLKIANKLDLTPLLPLHKII